MSDWISVDERLPEVGEYVIGANPRDDRSWYIHSGFATDERRYMDQRRAIIKAIHKLSEERQQEFVAQDQIVEETGLDPNIVSLCLEVMIEQDCVYGAQTFGGWIVKLPARTVLALKGITFE